MQTDKYLDALLSLPDVRNALVSPDGKWVAWTWYGLGPVTDIYAAPTDGSAGPLRLTESPENSWLVDWTPDSQAVLVREDHDGDERYRLWLVDLTQPGQRQALTEASPDYFLRGGQMHPNRLWLFYGANFDTDTGKPIEPTWIYRHDLQTGERVALARPVQAGTYAPQLNRTGTHLLYNRRGQNPAGSQVWLVDVAGQTDREILNFGDSAKVSASWLPDGQRVLFLAEAGNYRRLGLWDLATGTYNWLVDDPARNLEEAYVPYRSDRAVVVEIRQARTQVSLLDLASGQESFLPQVPGNLVPLAPVEGGEWVGRYYSASQPAEVVRFSLEKAGETSALLSISRMWERASLKSQDLIPAQDFRWQAEDGREIQGWLYRTGLPAKGTVVYIHGGPTAHSEDRFNSQIQFLVAQGFNVLDPNYRGSTGFGLDFQEAIKVDGWGGLEQLDIKTGIEALIRAEVAEAGKVGVTGTSYGGYSSWHAITHFPIEVVAASAPICGMTDLVVDYETTRPDLRPYSEEMLGGRPDQLPQKYYERSPINFVNHIKGRLLIVQGLQDPNVTPDNVRVVKEALSRAGVAFEVLEFDDEGHGIGKPKNRRTLYRRLADFFGAAFES
jgi:dipeptidyl aminopeptidase/acylaminoacyl peptidase